MELSLNEIGWYFFLTSDSDEPVFANFFESTACVLAACFVSVFWLFFAWDIFDFEDLSEIFVRGHKAFAWIFADRSSSLAKAEDLAPVNFIESAVPLLNVAICGQAVVIIAFKRAFLP